MNNFPYSTIAVSGEDARDFLQAQLAGDLNRLPESRLAAWCNPKGRVIVLFRVIETDSGIDLVLPAELAQAAVDRLTMFRFRARVEFDIRTAAAAEIGVADSYEDWRLANLRAGIPEILGAQSEVFTPHMLNLDLLGAVSVDKGCYPGQEIVARTHFRGATKRRLLRFESSAPVAAGDKVSLDGRDIGEVLNAIDRDLLAVVPVANAADPLTVKDVQLVNLPLPYFE